MLGLPKYRQQFSGVMHWYNFRSTFKMVSKVTRKADTTMEKINQLYKKLAFLRNKLRLQRETMARERRRENLHIVMKTRRDIKTIRQEIDTLLDNDY